MRSLNGLETVTVILQLIVPLALIAHVAVGRHRDALSLAVGGLLAFLYVTAIAVAGLWLVLPWNVSVLYLILLAGAAWLGARRLCSPTGAVRTGRLDIGVWLRGGLAVVFLVASVHALSGRRGSGEDPVHLESPFRGGTYLVAAGGSVALLNPHLSLSRDGYRAYRGQSYAIDLVKQGGWGSRRSVPFPADPTGYAIFGEPVHAPCSGRVIAAVDGHPDQLPGGSVPAALEGNHVILDCGDVWVVLAHFEIGSVGVAEGDNVRTGDLLARVGNSGRSDEPHLHLHAQTPGKRGASMEATPLPLTLDGRHLVRNDRVRGRRQLEYRGHPGAPADRRAPNRGTEHQTEERVQ